MNKSNKTIFIASVLAAHCASVGASQSPQSIDRSELPVYSKQTGNVHVTGLGSEDSIQGRSTTFYENLISDNAANFPNNATGRLVGTSDFISVAQAPILMDSFTFIGGVLNPGETIFFDFLDSEGEFIDSFGVTLQSQVAQVTITFDEPMLIEETGFVQMFAPDLNDLGPGSPAMTGIWIVNSVEPTIGSDTFADEFTLSGEPLNHKMAIAGTEVDMPDLPCADTDNDNDVDIEDLINVLAQFGSVGSGDFDQDGTVGIEDLIIVLAAFGTNCQ